MGYSHAFELKKEIEKIPEECLSKIKDSMNEERWKDILTFECDSTEPPVVTEKEIRFNGYDENGYETFMFKVDDLYNNCKTNENDYDFPVCVVLLLLFNYIPEFKLKSDGFWLREHQAKKYKEKKIVELDGNWNNALDYVEERFGIEFEWFLNEIDENHFKYYKMEICRKTVV